MLFAKPSKNVPSWDVDSGIEFTLTPRGFLIKTVPVSGFWATPQLDISPRRSGSWLQKLKASAQPSLLWCSRSEDRSQHLVCLGMGTHESPGSRLLGLEKVPLTGKDLVQDFPIGSPGSFLDPRPRVLSGAFPSHATR